jgi:hypothetical protein
MIEKYENKFYRSFYLNPAYIARRFINCVKNGTLLQTIRAAASIDWFVRN